MQIVRNRPVSISEDKTLPINLDMTNTTFMGVQVEIFDSYPPFFRLKKGTNTALVTVPGRGYARLSYELQPTSIGEHEFGPMHLIMRDIAGLFFYQRDIDVHGSVEVTPRVRELARGSLAANAFSSYSGPIVSRRKTGPDSENPQPSRPAPAHPGQPTPPRPSHNQESQTGPGQGPYSLLHPLRSRDEGGAGESQTAESDEPRGSHHITLLAAVRIARPSRIGQDDICDQNSPQLAGQRTADAGGRKPGSPVVRRWTRRPILLARPARGRAPSLGRLLSTTRTFNRLHPQSPIY